MPPAPIPRLRPLSDCKRSSFWTQERQEPGDTAERCRQTPLPPSSLTLRLAAVTEQAIEVLGSQDAAERWLATPALGFDWRRPIDLLQSSEGTELVKTLLTRMDHGVYA